MSKIREKLKEKATESLAAMVDHGRDELEGVCMHSGVTAEELARLIGNTRTGTLETDLTRKLVNQYEDQLIKDFNTQEDLPLDPEPEEKGDSL